MEVACEFASIAAIVRIGTLYEHLNRSIPALSKQMATGHQTDERTNELEVKSQHSET